MPYVTLDDTTAFRAERILPDRWNGWVNPVFDRDGAEAVAQWVNAQMANHGRDDVLTLEWDGDVLILTEPDEEPYTLTPDDDGNYAIGNYGWTWQEARG